MLGIAVGEQNSLAGPQLWGQCPLAAILRSLKFSELLFIYLVYFVSKRSFAT